LLRIVVHLARESKFVDNLENLRSSEQQKIACGQKHFKAIDVGFKPVIQMTLDDLISCFLSVSLYIS